MAAKKRGLGRGLNALLGNAAEVKQLTDPAPAPVSGESSPAGLAHIAVDLIRRGTYQPRVHFEPEALQELAESIKSQGVVQPIVVRPIAAGGYELIAGERRWRATQLAGLGEIPAVIKELDDQAAAAVSLIENIQRENLNPLEESRALQRLIDEFDMTHQQVAETVSRSRASVSNLLRLKDLNEDVKLLVDERQIEMGHARALLGLTGTEQSLLAKKVADKGLSVRETEALVRKQLNPVVKVKRADAATDPDIKRLTDELSERLGAAVNIQTKGAGGKLVISYNSLDELDGILAKIH
ncbi:MAG: ParB/RepB/Spo0J family partition protein [Gammaproteobacteria bacterium]|nr:ParB/RepB/Spo0J family partition protein [Gammaproteobacteria bacterium]